jgi:3-hydroxybutyryl-CoA dehydratase
MTTLEKDFEALREGDRFATRGRTVTETDVVLFGGLTGDTHPQHTDAEWAAAGRFEGRIAHGLLVLSYAAGLVPFDPEQVVALRRVRDVVFKAPVRIGDTIRVEGEVESKRELDAGHGLVGCRWRVLNQQGSLVTRASVEVVWRREPAGAGAESDGQPESDQQPVLI